MRFMVSTVFAMGNAIVFRIMLSWFSWVPGLGAENIENVAAANGAVLLLMLAAHSAYAENCSDYPNGIIDGATGTPVPDQIQVDRNCTIRNFPASNPPTRRCSHRSPATMPHSSCCCRRSSTRTSSFARRKRN